MNDKNASVMPGRNARFPFIGMLVLIVGLLFCFSQRSIAAGGHKADNASNFGATILVTQDNQIANSGSPDIIQVTLSPAPNPGDDLEFTISTSSYTPLITTDPTTGIATLEFAGTTVGPATVTVYDQTTGTTLGTVTVNFISALPSQTTSYLTVVTSPEPADGSSQDEVEAVVKDQYGNLVADGTVVTFTAIVGSATVTSTGVTSGGIAIAYLTSTTVGSVEVQAVTTGSSGSFPIYAQGSTTPYVTVQFTNPPPSQATSYIVATVTPQPADGTSQDVVEAVVNMANGLPVADGTVITFTMSTPTATMTTTGVTSGGVVYAYFTSTTVGTLNIQAQATGSSGTFYLFAQGSTTVNFVPIQFTTPPVNPAASYITATATPTSADGTAQDVVTATLYTTAGQPAGAGIAVTFSVETGTATITTTGVTNASGVATAYLTSTIVGSVNVQAQVTVGGVTSYLDQQSPNNTLNYATVAFVAGGIDPAKSFFLVFQSPEAADGSSQDIVEVLLYDSTGHPILTPTTVTFTTLSGVATPVGTTTPSTVAGSVQMAYTSTTVGSVQVQAQVTVNGVAYYLNDEANPTNNYTTIQFTTPPVNPAASYITAIATPTSADGTAQDVVTATLFTTTGQPAGAGIAVTFTIETGTATITTTGVTDASGVATAYLTSTIVGSVNVQAQVTVGGVTSYLDQQSPNNTLNYATVAFVAGGIDPAKSVFVVVQSPEPADGSSQDIVEVLLYDSTGHPVLTPTQVTFSILSGVATPVGTTTPSTVAGSAQMAYTSLTVGSAQVQAQITVNGVNYYLNDQANPGNNYTTIQFTTLPPDPTTSYISPVTTVASADGTAQDEVTATIYTTSGALAGAGVPVTFTISTGTATITTTGVTNASGVATAYLTSTIVGTVDVQAQINGVAPYLNQQSGSPDFVPVQFVVGAIDPAKSVFVVVQNPAPADNSSQDIVEVLLYDSTGHPVLTPTQVTFSILSGVATPASTTTPTTVAGTAQMAYVSTAVGYVQVQAQITVGGVNYYLNDQANPTNNYTTIQFTTSTPVVGPPGGGGGSSSGYTYVQMTYNDVQADGVQTDTATAYITDGYQHPIAGETVYFTFTPGGSANSGAMFQPGGATIIDSVVTNANGYAAMAISDTVIGTAWVDAWIKVGGVLTEISGDSVLANFSPAPDVNNPQTQLIVLVYEALADGVTRTAVEAHIVDYTGQPVVGATVQFSIDSGTAQIVGSQPVITDANGNAIIYLTSTTPGNVLVTATVNSKAIIYGSPARVYFAPINIYVPRVFTPNGDGVNDVLKPILVGIQTFQYFTVYNRWGNIIFQTTDPNQGWDGTFKGVPQPVETYLWIAAGVDENGKTVVQKGMTSLVR